MPTIPAGPIESSTMFIYDEMTGVSFLTKAQLEALKEKGKRIPGQQVSIEEANVLALLRIVESIDGISDEIQDVTTAVEKVALELDFIKDGVSAGRD